MITHTTEPDVDAGWYQTAPLDELPPNPTDVPYEHLSSPGFLLPITDTAILAGAGGLVPVGWSTWFGTLATVAGVLIPVIDEAKDGPLGAVIPPWLWPLAGSVLGLAVIIGRQLQALTKGKSAGAAS